MYKLTTKWFYKWAKKQSLSEDALLKAIDDLEDNLATSALGGGLYKVRVAKEGFGKRSSFRTIIVYKKRDRAIVVYGFAKNEKDNLSASELKNFKILASDLLSLGQEEIELLIQEKELIEIDTGR